MIMNRDQNAGRSHNMKIDNRSFESVEVFKFRKKIRAYWSKGTIAIIQCRIFCPRVCYPKIYRSRYI